MKKIGLICLAVVLTLGIAGVGFGWWSETLDIGQNPINTGELRATFCDGAHVGDGISGAGVISNDDNDNTLAIWVDGSAPVVPDPDDNGGDPTAPQTMGQAVNRTDHFATTTVSGSNTQLMTVTMTNAYPSYYPTVFFTIRNWGTIPAKVKSIKVIEVSVDTTKTTVDIPLAVCTDVYLNCDGDGDNDLKLHLSDDAPAYYGPALHLFDVMEAGGHYHESAVSGNLSIHVEEGAEENVSYDFTIEIVVVPFNG